MEQVKYVMSVVLSIVFFAMESAPVYAGYMESPDTYAVVTVRAEITEEFVGKIIVGLTHEKTGVTFSVLLSAENEFENKLDVINNDDYTLSARIEAEGEYKTTLPERCRVENNKSELVFGISKKNTAEVIEGNIPHGEELYNLSEVEEGEKIVANFFEKVSFIANDEKYKNFLDLYTGDMFLKYYLDIDSTNTREQWNAMGSYEKFVYYITYIMPYTRLMKNEYSDVNQYTDELVAQKNMLNSIGGGDDIFNAIEQLWVWHYNYWTHTGTFYNFYDYNMEANISSQNDTARVLPLENDLAGILKEEPGALNAPADTDMEGSTDSTDHGSFIQILGRYCNITTIVGILSVLFLVLYPQIRKKGERKKRNG